MPPAVRLAAQIALQRESEHFWAAVTLAEAGLCEALLDAARTEDEVRRRLRAGRTMQTRLRGLAGPRSSVRTELRGSGQDLDSSVTQLRLLGGHGLPRALIDAVAEGLANGAGAMVTLDPP